MEHFGPQGWWPGETSQEHLAGCVLAQNTRWDRVEPVIQRLKDIGILYDYRVLDVPSEELAALLKGSGTYRRKAEYLRAVWAYMAELNWDGSPGSVSVDTDSLRGGLLSIKGVGPETADCILLYVMGRPVFVVDSYTRRILSRHGLCSEKASYHEIQKLFHDALDPDAEVFSEFHALLVACAKLFCRPVPQCGGCPLRYHGFIPYIPAPCAEGCRSG